MGWRQVLSQDVAPVEKLKPGTIKQFWSIRYTIEFGYDYYYYGRFPTKEAAEDDLRFGTARKFYGERDTKVVLKSWAYYPSGWVAT
jgi:hypothetical protein